MDRNGQEWAHIVSCRVALGFIGPAGSNTIVRPVDRRCHYCYGILVPVSTSPIKQQ